MNIHILTIANDDIRKRKNFTGADWWFAYLMVCPCCKNYFDVPSPIEVQCPRCPCNMECQESLEIRVAKELTDWREAMSLAVHEAVEALISKHMGVTVQQVDDYDAKFEREHPGDGTTNVGDIDDCPYRQPHNFATAAERVLASALNVSWQQYDDRLSAL